MTSRQREAGRPHDRIGAGASLGRARRFAKPDVKVTQAWIGPEYDRLRRRDKGEGISLARSESVVAIQRSRSRSGARHGLRLALAVVLFVTACTSRSESSGVVQVSSAPTKSTYEGAGIQGATVPVELADVLADADALAEVRSSHSVHRNSTRARARSIRRCRVSGESSRQRTWSSAFPTCYGNAKVAM